MPRLEFRHVHSYPSTLGGISVPVVLRSGAETVDLLAYVDTGAGNCLFEREHCEMVNLDIAAGEPKTFWTATGRVDTFGHVVSLEVLDLKFESMVYFFANRNLLGRTGWLDRVRFGLVDYDRMLYLSAYDFDRE